MRSVRQNGFVSVLVIATIALIGVEILVLTAGSNAILFQSNTAYLDACEQNLIASGLAWAEKNIKHGSQEGFDKPVSFDITDMNISRTTLSVTVNTPKNGEADVQVDSSVSRNRQRFRCKQKYRIKL